MKRNAKRRNQKRSAGVKRGLLTWRWSISLVGEQGILGDQLRAAEREIRGRIN